jgi:hypothetical protein
MRNQAQPFVHFLQALDREVWTIGRVNERHRRAFGSLAVRKLGPLREPDGSFIAGADTPTVRQITALTATHTAPGSRPLLESESRSERHRKRLRPRMDWQGPSRMQSR